MKFLVPSLILTFLSMQIFAQDPTAIRKKHMNLDNGVAIDGYDPVSYFTMHKAVKGNKELSVYHQGAIYYFSSAENKEKFKTNPSAYEPQYGGWCAYAMGATGEKVSVDPETFKIINNRLYLFYNRFFNNTLKSWNKDEQNLNMKANQNWNKMFH
jgi:YHS domain-containing protein